MKFWKVLIIILSVITVLALLIAGCVGVGVYMIISEKEAAVETPNNNHNNGGVIIIRPGKDDKEEGKQEDAVVEAPEHFYELSDIIVGDWVIAERHGDYINTTYYSFLPDGTFNAGGCEYMHTSVNPELFYEGAEGWEAVPMGFPYEYGTYTVYDNYVEIVCLGIEFEEYNEPYVIRMSISEYDGQSAVFIANLENGSCSEAKRFLKDFKYERVEELCEALNIDVTP